MVTAIATETGGDGGVEDTVFCKKSKHTFCSNQFRFVNTLQTNVYYYCTQKKKMPIARMNRNICQFVR